MEPVEQEMSLRDYWQVVARRKAILITAVLAALAGALTLSLLQEPIYSAEAQMLVEPRSGEALFEDDPTLAIQNLDRAIQTEIHRGVVFNEWQRCMVISTGCTMVVWFAKLRKV